MAFWRIALVGGEDDWRTLNFDTGTHLSAGAVAEAIAQKFEQSERSRLKLFRVSTADKKPTAADCEAAIADPSKHIDNVEDLTDAEVRTRVLPNKAWLLLKVDAPPAAAAGAGGASSAAAAPLDAFGEPFELTHLRGLRVASPSKDNAPAERRLLGAPLSIDFDASVAASFSDVIAEQAKTSDKSWEGLMTEATFYPLATKFVPVWVDATTRASTASANATAVFGGTTKPEGPYALTLPWDAEPELFITTAPGKAPFNGELKTAGDKRAFDGVADYLLLGMARSLFQAPASTWRFYRRPPVGFGVVGFPYAAHLVSVELIGHLFVAPASKPFVMASPEHEAAVRAIPDVAFGEPIDFRADELRDRGKLCHYRGIFWTTEPVGGFFLKFLPETAPSARSRFEQIFRIYRHLSALPVDGRPPAVQTAELLFGFLCLCVRMPFVRGRAPTEAEFLSARVLGDIADALAWLLQHQVLYVDVRLPNVVIEPDVAGSHATRVFLVDYDDAVVLPAAPTSSSDVRRILAENKNVDWPDQLLEAVASRFAD